MWVLQQHCCCLCNPTCWPCSHNSHIVVLHLSQHTQLIALKVFYQMTTCGPRGDATSVHVQHLWLTFGECDATGSVLRLAAQANKRDVKCYDVCSS